MQGSTTEENPAEYFMERLRKLRQQVGLEPGNAPVSSTASQDSSGDILDKARVLRAQVGLGSNSEEPAEIGSVRESSPVCICFFSSKQL